MWIHGGGYEIGSASLYGYTGFADFYIPQDIVVISVQYRIGVYGESHSIQQFHLEVKIHSHYRIKGVFPLKLS